MFEKFQDWLKVNKPDSKGQYSAAYTAINKVNVNNGLTLLQDWKIEEWDTLYKLLIEKEEFQILNKSGHNNLTSALAQYKKYLESIPEVTIPPIKPFEDFKWRWAVTTPSEGLNRKDILIGVLKVLVEHNGKRHATQEFRNDLIELENSISDSAISLSKKEDSAGDARSLSKNIIENSGQYWKALDLINSTSDGTISVTDFGKSIIEDNLSDESIVKWQIENFKIPNEKIENEDTIALYRVHDIAINPFKLLFKVLSGLTQYVKSPSDWYITVNEVQTIIVPLSVNASIDISIYVEKIIEYRTDKTAFASWPNCTPGANDLRMLKEYFIFLNNFGALTEIDVKNVGLRYYVNEMTINLMEDYKITTFPTSRVKKNILASNIIYFGSPGTGKSNTVDEITKGSKVRKVTFHPEYDYYNFVGGYKPSMEGKDIVYKFIPQIFTKIYAEAWQNPDEHYYLQIEEINRGNCAEIFGDLFQLLDRDIDGSSKYEVDANEELIVYLTEKLGSGHVGIFDHKIKLPSNLSIIATMNTSDQSLFPMDSAFKRRWNWEYVKINYTCKESDFTIVLNNGSTYKWLEFLESVNRLILEVTDSPDKQIGNWFINAKATDNKISEKVFINKVLFYLWNDVFKDEDESLFKVSDERVTYEDLFNTSNDDSKLIIKIIDEHLKLKNQTKRSVQESVNEENIASE